MQEMMETLNVLPVGLGIIGIMTVILFMVWITGRKSPGIPMPAPAVINEEKEEIKSILGTGDLPCYVLRDGKLQPSTIPVPIGHLFTADTSMPRSGACYLVKEENGKVVPYDPRQEPYNSERNPQRAYSALHWEEVKDVFSYPDPWWQSAPLWVCLASFVLMFIMALVVFG